MRGGFASEGKSSKGAALCALRLSALLTTLGYGFIFYGIMTYVYLKIYIYIYRERDFIRIIKKEVEQRVENIEQGNHLLTLNSINLTWETT